MSDIAATAIGTARLRDRAVASGTHPDAYRPFGNTGLTVSAIGFGGLRASDKIADHRSALDASLDAGCNLVDTAPTYVGGASERLVGDVLRGRPRDEFIVITKLGYVQGEAKARADERAATGRPYPGIVRITEGVHYGLDPELLADELTVSCARLGLPYVDVVMVHDPEAWLAYAEGSVVERYAAFREALREAFRWLEGLVQAGRIGWYGICSEALVPTREPSTAGIGFDDIVALAHEVGGPEHHFAAVALPINVLELSALEPAGASVVDMARAVGVAVLATRPLNAILPQGLVRLVDLAPPTVAPRVERSRRVASRLEAEFETGIGAALAAGGATYVPAFRFAAALEQRASEVGEPVQFAEYVQGRLTAELGEVVQAFEPRLSAPLRAAFRFWLERYVASLTTLSAGLHGRCTERATARVRRVRRGVEAVLGHPGRLSTSQIALRGVLALPGVTAALVGMRRPEYVADTLAVLRWPFVTATADALHTWRNGEQPW